MEETFHSIKDIVKITGLCRGTIDNARKSGRLKYRTIGSRILIANSDLENWVGGPVNDRQGKENSLNS